MLLLLLLSRFSRVQLCATPQTAAHQAPPSLGFSRQEHWSGLPFPSPMHESESEVAQSCPTLRLRGLQPTRLLRLWDFPGKSTGVGCHCLLRFIVTSNCYIYASFCSSLSFSSFSLQTRSQSQLKLTWRASVRKQRNSTFCLLSWLIMVNVLRSMYLQFI